MTQVAIYFVTPQRIRLSGTVIEIWPFGVRPERLRQEPRSVGRDDAVGPQYYTDLIYSSSLRGVYTIQQMSSKLPTNVFKIHVLMLDVCWIV